MSPRRKGRPKKSTKRTRRHHARPRGASDVTDVRQLLDRAVRYHQAGQLDRARAGYEDVLRQDARNPDALHLMGVIDQQQGDPVAAVRSILRAIQIKPQSAVYHSNLSAAYQAAGQFAEAVAAAQKAVTLQPDFVDALLNLAKSSALNGQFPDAESTYLRVLQLQPSNVQALGMLAHLYETGNRLADAQAMVDRAMPLDSGDVLVHLVAAKCQRRAGRPGEALEHLQRLCRVNPRAKADRHVNFELAALYDQLQESDRAFEHFQRANELTRTSHRVTSRADNPHLQELAVLKETYTPQWVHSWTPSPSTVAATSPVFVFGFPRSGNTLLDQILNGHSQLQTLQESPSIGTVRDAVRALPGGYPIALANLTEPQITELRRRYFQVVDRHLQRRTECRLVDTYPLYTPHVGLLHRLFPEAKLVLVLRHPFDVCLSCFMQNFKLNHAMAQFLSLEETATYYARVMDMWDQYRRAIAPDHHVVRYENLVHDAVPELQRLCQYLEITWEEGMLRFDTEARTRGRINTPSYHQVTQGIYHHARYRWTRYARHLAPVLSRLEPYALRLGYPADPGECSPSLH